MWPADRLRDALLFAGWPLGVWPSPPQLIAHVLDQLEYACALDLVTETGPAGVALLGEAGEAAQQRELDCAFRRAFGLDEPSPGGAWGSAWGDSSGGTALPEEYWEDRASDEATAVAAAVHGADAA